MAPQQLAAARAQRPARRCTGRPQAGGRCANWQLLARAARPAHLDANSRVGVPLLLSLLLGRLACWVTGAHVISASCRPLPGAPCAACELRLRP